MGNAWFYQSALYCDKCALKLITDECLDACQEDAKDSDNFPQGPYANGGGESDCPQYCDDCGTFLENPLTEYGAEYVLSAVREFLPFKGQGSPGTIREWVEFYDVSLKELIAQAESERFK